MLSKTVAGRSAVSVLGALLLGGGCHGTGTLVGDVPDPADPAPGAGPASPGAGGTAGASSVPGGEGGRVAMMGAGGLPVGPAEPEACTAALDPGPVFLRRLTHTEYARAVRDLTGVTEAQTTDFVPESSLNGFRNNAESIVASTQQTERYADAAARLATAAMASPSLRAAWLAPACAALTAGNRATCTDTFVRGFGLRTFRRPLTPAEVTAYVDLAGQAATDPDAFAGLGLVMRAMLQSPKFLYRVETGAGGADATRPGWRRLDGYELATRLSFLIAGSIPDAALLTAAGQGRLDSAEGVRAAAMDLLSNRARAGEATREFYDQWLRLDGVGRTQRDPLLFPAFNPALGGAMAEEAHRLIDDILWSPGAGVLDLLTARHTFVNPTLAAHYHVAAPAPGAWTRVSFADGDERGGLLGLAGLWTVVWKQDAEPILRGKFVRQALLCQEPAPPPPNAGPLPAPVPGETQRQQLARHRRDPSCSVCHDMFDPIGFGLERFDGVGGLRAADAGGQPLSAAGSLEGVAGVADPAFVGARGLAQKLAATPEFPACVATQLFQYAFGRTAVRGDACALQQITRAYAGAGHRYPDLILAIVSNDSFRYRRNDAGETP